MILFCQKLYFQLPSKWSLCHVLNRFRSPSDYSGRFPWTFFSDCIKQRKYWAILRLGRTFDHANSLRPQLRFCKCPGSVLVRTRARILKIHSVCLRRGSVIPLPLYSFRMVEKGIVTVFCHFALLAFISKSVDARAGVSIYVSFNPFFIIVVNCFGSAYSSTKSGDRWLDRSAGSQNSTYRFLAIFVKRRAAKGRSL